MLLYFIAVLLFPAVLTAAIALSGLALRRIAGPAFPYALCFPAGLAALIAVTQLLTLIHPPALVSSIALLAFLALSAAIGRSDLSNLARAWNLWLPFLLVYALYILPVALAFRPTQPGYLLDTTVAIQLLGGDYLLSHGRHFADLPVSSLRLTLESYFGSQYPSGGTVLLAAFSKLLGVDSLWLFYPYLALCTALSAPVIYEIGSRIGLSRLFALIGAIISPSAALVYAYAYMGSIKEITVLPLIMCLPLTAVIWASLHPLKVRPTILPSVVVGAGISSIGLPFLAWLALALVVALVAVRLNHGLSLGTWKALLGSLLVAPPVVAVASLPAVLDLAKSIRLASMLSAANTSLANDPGNLLRPLRPEQMLGIWLTGTHRVDPPDPWFRLTYIGIGIVAVLLVVGLVYLVHASRRIFAVWVSGTLILWLLLTIRGTNWTDAKVLMLTSPVAVLAAIVGAYALTEWRKAAALALVGVLSVGVLLSDAFTYHDTNLLPTTRYRELLRIASKVPTNARTLVPEFDEYALYALRHAAIDGPGFASKPQWLLHLRDGSLTGYGMSYDLDSLSEATLERYAWIVKRRRPDVSRPPSGFKLAWAGRYYEVWQHARGSGRAGRIVEHVPLGAQGDPGGMVRCADLAARLQRVDKHGRRVELIGAVVPEMMRIDPRNATLSGTWTATPQGVALNGPGMLTARVRLRGSGPWTVWVGGNIARKVEVQIDQRRVETLSYESGNAGNYFAPVTYELSKGVHTVVLIKGGGSLRPGDNAYSEVQSIVLTRGSRERLVRVPPQAGRRLCGRRLDWVEIVEK